MGALLLENQIWLFPKAKSCAQGRYKHTDRRQLLDKVVGNMNQVLVFMKTLLEPFALFIFQEIKVNSSIQEGLFLLNMLFSLTWRSSWKSID